MNKTELDFDSFNLLGRRVLIELPTKTSGGLIYMTDKKALDSGWFRVVKVGDEVVKVKAGQEVFVYFSNEPYHIDELVFRKRSEQLEDIKSEEFAKSVQVNLGAPKDNLFKLPPIERKFCEIGDFDIHFVREYQDETVKEGK